MRKSIAAVIVLLTRLTLFGQTFDTEFNPLHEGGQTRHREEDTRTEHPDFQTDDHIFHSPAWEAADPFRDLSRYRFGAVRYRERGLDDRHHKVLLGGVDLSDNISPWPDYTLISLLWKTPLARGYTPALVAGSTGTGIGTGTGASIGAGIGYTETYSLRPLRPQEFYVALRAADRYSRAGLDVRQSGRWKRGWSHSATATGQFGADGHIRGIRSDEAGGAVTLDKICTGGQILYFFVAGNISQRGIRSAATREAFELTGDNLYNPTWGWQDGRVRNSRRRNVRQVFTAAALETPLGEGRKLTLTTAFRRSRNGQTRLAWYYAHSPMPDYYRSMPSFFPDWSAADVIAGAWRDDDPTVTQVDWEAFYHTNTLSQDGSATYILEEQVELSSDAHLNATIDRELSKELTVSYGIRVRRDNSRFFKEAGDMLGAEWVPNIDQYVTDDEGDYHTGTLNENDLRNPGRRVRRGERFGYDYALTRWMPSALGIVRWNRTNYGLTASASLTHTRLRREGFYEKALFPGGASFGKSTTAAFTTYSLGAAAYLNLSLRHRLSVAALASSEPPRADDIFVSPRQNNHLLAGLTPTGIYGAEVSWAFTGEDVDLRVTGFVNASTGATEIRQYYDDLASTFSNMAVRGVDKLGYGVEAGAEVRFARWLSMTLGGSVGEYRYNSEPRATVYADEDNSVISEGIVCYMSGLATGPPQAVAAAVLTYSDRHRWRVALAGEWMGGRWVDINPLYHSSRITGINPAPEIMRLFTEQERLPDAFTLGASVSKGFVLGRGYLRLAAAVRNVLSSQIVYSGYEQMRIMRRGSGTNRVLLPFPSKYLWSYPLTWSVSVSYRL